MKRKATFLFAGLMGMYSVFYSSSMRAMGTPPQKAAKPASEAGSNAVILKNDDLRVSPDAAAASLLRLEKGGRVRLLASQNGWSQISVAGKTGWVRVLSVSADSRESIELSDLGALGKTPQGKVVAIAGTRGLDEERLKSAGYNALELDLLQSYAMSRTEAEQFALAAGLQVRAMSYLVAPVQRQNANPDSPWKGY